MDALLTLSVLKEDDLGETEALVSELSASLKVARLREATSETQVAYSLL